MRLKENSKQTKNSIKFPSTLSILPHTSSYEYTEYSYGKKTENKSNINDKHSWNCMSKSAETAKHGQVYLVGECRWKDNWAIVCKNLPVSHST